MKRSLLLGALLLVLATPYFASAYSISDVNSLLTGYGVPSQIVAALSPVQVTQAGHSYVILSTVGKIYFVVNVSSSPYTIVLNATSIYGVIRNYTINQSIAQENFTALRDAMQAYVQTSSFAYNECLQFTGLNTGITCTLTNYCASCQAIPHCAQALVAFGGPSSVFGAGIMQFGNLSVALNSSLSAFYSATYNVTSDNAAQKIAQLNSAYANISSLTHSLPLDSLFPTPSNVTSSMIATCVNYASIYAAPWYCKMSNYCDALTYNYSKLAGAGLLMDQLASMPVSSTQIMQSAKNVSSSETTYILPILSSQKLAQLDAMLNGSVPGYAVLVNNTALLLGHVNDSSLMAMLLALEGTYRNATSNYLTENFSAVNETLAMQYSSLSTYFVSLNRSYSSAVSLSKNNTAKLLGLQIDSNHISSQLASAALLQSSINTQLSGRQGISNVSVLASQAMHVASQLAPYSVYSISIVELARWADSGFIGAMASALGTGYNSSVALAPLFGALLSLIIGIVLFAALWAFYHYMRAKRRIMHNERTRHNWRNVFRLAMVLIAIYVIGTYVVLAYANSSAPFGAFQSAYQQAGSVAIALNGTPAPSASQYACSGEISSAAAAAGKHAFVATFSNGICKTSNATSTISDCLNYYASRGIPVVVLSNSNISSASLYSLYGTVLSLGGNESVMNACYASLLLN